MTRRHKARRWVLQILYAWDLQGQQGDLRAEAAAFFLRRRVGETGRRFAERLIEAVAGNGPAIDAHLTENTPGWALERLGAIDRNILRIAIAEFLFLDDVPFKVTIDEAVTLAGRFGGDDSPRFVNGILDAVAHRLDLIPS
ncbi:MAG: transcription antitermination factor NusB [Gemmatimonadota bacterium]